MISRANRLGLILAPALSGCYTSSINTDATARANAHFKESEQEREAHVGLYHDRLVRLWADEPEYVALLGTCDCESRSHCRRFFHPGRTGALRSRVCDRWLAPGFFCVR